jgi:hypothetical protein
VIITRIRMMRIELLSKQKSSQVLLGSLIILQEPGWLGRGSNLSGRNLADLGCTDVYEVAPVKAQISRKSDAGNAKRRSSTSYMCNKLHTVRIMK